MYYIECLKCHSTFEDIPDKDLPAGILCPECRKRGYMCVGVCHRYDEDGNCCDVLPEPIAENI